MRIKPFLFLFLTISGFSQQGVPAAGGTVSGTLGSFSVSVGQAVNGYLQNATHTVSQGVQQTYAAYTTQVKAVQCDTVLANLDTAIVADTIVGAQKYRFEVTNGNNVSTIENLNNSFTLAQFSGGACFNTAYAIRVAVQYGSLWYDYGTSCTVTTPDITPTTAAQTLCASATVANLTATGTAIKWYTSASGGTALPTTTILTTGTYYVSQTVNGCESSRTAVNITVTPNTTPIFTQVGAVCLGTNVAALPSTSTNGISGTWLPAVNPNITTTYTFTPTAGQCATTTTQTIIITAPVVTSAISFVAPAPVASIGVLNVGSATITGTLTNGIAASGVSASIPYTGGNGISYAAQTISSTGVSGLTATLLSGVLANGAGSLLYTISGTPSASGTVSFTITIGGQSGTFTILMAVNLVAQYPTGSVFCDSTPTAIVDVTNPITGKVWMDRNLGARRVATSISDVNAFGDFYQWGRVADGHQCANSSTTTTLSSTDQPANANFILAPSSNFDWRSPENINLWQGVNGINNPCPNGYRIPTKAEWTAEINSWNGGNASSSLLKLTLSGNRRWDNGEIENVNIRGSYWSSSTDGGAGSHYLEFDNNSSGADYSYPRSYGRCVRCIKN